MSETQKKPAKRKKRMAPLTPQNRLTKALAKVKDLVKNEVEQIVTARGGPLVEGVRIVTGKARSGHKYIVIATKLTTTSLPIMSVPVGVMDGKVTVGQHQRRGGSISENGTHEWACTLFNERHQMLAVNVPYPEAIRKALEIILGQFTARDIRTIADKNEGVFYDRQIQVLEPDGRPSNMNTTQSVIFFELPLAELEKLGISVELGLMPQIDTDGILRLIPGPHFVTLGGVEPNFIRWWNQNRRTASQTWVRGDTLANQNNWWNSICEQVLEMGYLLKDVDAAETVFGELKIEDEKEEIDGDGEVIEHTGRITVGSLIEQSNKNGVWVFSRTDPRFGEARETRRQANVPELLGRTEKPETQLNPLEGKIPAGI